MLGALPRTGDKDPLRISYYKSHYHTLTKSPDIGEQLSQTWTTCCQTSSEDKSPIMRAPSVGDLVSCCHQHLTGIQMKVASSSYFPSSHPPPDFLMVTRNKKQ